MCAICGIVNFHGEPVSETKLLAMRDTMTNRGPDDAGLHIDGAVGLGHRRLKIIDLSERARQPMTNEDGTVWVVFNGEIYNFQALREILAARGHEFVSQSDTEVIVHGYEAWGEEVFAKLDGMFAIGIWDARKETLLLGRDRFGKKPLYYRRTKECVHFASDIKALLVVDRAAFTINLAAVDCYLHHLGVTQDHCIFNEAAKVKPAHYHVFTREGERSVRYWQPSFREKRNGTENDILLQMEERLDAAVRRRLISDVPLGAFLSGGVDSSLVVAMMSRASSKPVRTFSVGFDEADYSELAYSRKVAKCYQTEHLEIMLKPDVLEILPSLVWEYGEPFADSSAIPTYYVARAARQHVTVALTGDGGDELFGGYDIARASHYADVLDRWCPEALKAKLAAWLMREGSAAEFEPLLHKLKTLLAFASDDPAVRHGSSMAFNARQRARLYTAQFRTSVGAHQPHRIYEAFTSELTGLNLVDQNLLLTLLTRLPNDYLVKIDVASMKSALELRSPFLDTELAALANAIDPELKVRGGQQKYLLKKLAARYLPNEVVYRRKQGFALPLDHWFRGELAPVFERFVLRGRLLEQGWFHRAYVDQLAHEHASGKAEHTHRLWSLLWLEIWWRLFMDRTMMPGDSLKG